MLKKTLAADVRKLWEVLREPNERWRIALLRNKQLAKKAVRAQGVVSASGRELLALDLTARQYPEAVQLAVRKYWRAGKLDAGLALVEDIWTDQGTTSGEFAFACAQTWHQYGRNQQADVALAVAKRLAPENVGVFSFEAELQARRGNLHAALSAAKNILNLTRDHESAEKWGLFLAEQNYRLDQYAEVVRFIEPHLGEGTAWRRHYEYAHALEELGSFEESRAEFLKCAVKAVPRARAGFEIAELHFKAERHQAMLEELLRLEGHTELGSPLEEAEHSRLKARAFLALGRFDECAELALGAKRSPQLAEYGALALELAGRLPEALRLYSDLSKTPIPSKRRDMILRRFSRVAHVLGEYEQAVKAEVMYLSDVGQLSKLSAEVDPAFAQLADDTNLAMGSADWDRAISNLRRMSRSASSGANISKVNRTLGLLLAELGETEQASVAFFANNPYAMPNSGEANAKPSVLQGTERYSEALQTTNLASNTVLYESFYGAKTACNPLAICLALLEDPKSTHLQHVWVVNEDAPIHEKLLNRENVQFVRYMSTGYMMHLAVAGTLVNNSTFPRWFVRREGQRYINTWHGTPWKHMGLDVAEDSFSYENVSRNLLQASDLLLPNEFAADTMLRTQEVDALVRRRPYLIGSPRVDRTLRQTPAEKESLFRQLGLSGERPVVFYAPTWRGKMASRESAGSFIQDIVEVIAEHNVDVIVRAHYFEVGSLDYAKLPDNVVIPSDAVDTNELLGISDVLISDYSSVIFDYAPLNRPIIKHVYDLVEYTSERGLYFGVEDVPGVSSSGLAQLREQLELCLKPGTIDADWSGYPTAHLWAGEDGAATQRAVDLITSDLTVSDAPTNPLLISMNSLNPNGITRSFGNLIDTAAPRIGHVQAMLPTHFFSSVENERAASSLRPNVSYTLRSSFHTGTRQERIVWGKLTPLRERFPQDLAPWLKSRMRTEFRRMFSDVTFDAVVDFDGHDLYSAALLAYGPGQDTERVYVGHNEFCAEMLMRFPNHRGIGTVLNGFTNIAAVSEAVMEANREGLFERFGVPADLHSVLPNTLNVESIRENGGAPLDEDLEQWFEQPGTHLIMVGWLSPEKNHLMALEALKQVRNAGKTVDLIVLGDGPLRADLERAVVQLGLADAVFFAGQRANPYPSLKRAAGLLLSSKHEGQPMVFLEAMTLATPIAASRIPASVSTLEDGKHGLLMPMTVDGIAEGISSLDEKRVQTAVFDPESYREQAVSRFLEIIAG